MDGAVLDTRQKEDVLVQIGNLSRKPGSVLKAMHDDLIKEILGEKIVESHDKKKSSRKKDDIEPPDDIPKIIIGKERDIPYRLAQCCHPRPEDAKIVGVIGQGIVTVHRFDCEEVDKVDLERRIPARWSHLPEKNTVTFTIEATFHDKRGILMTFTQIFYRLGLDIKGIHSESISDHQIKNTFTLETEDDDYYIYDRLEARIRFEVPEVTELKLISMQ